MPTQSMRESSALAVKLARVLRARRTTHRAALQAVHKVYAELLSTGLGQWASEKLNDTVHEILRETGLSSADAARLTWAKRTEVKRRKRT